MQPASTIDSAEVDDAPLEPSGGIGSLGAILGLLVLAWGAVLASTPLNDNSFFTHLATGRLILDEGRVPTSDPYTFTALGEPWTVQSWLASLLYAGAEQLAGGVGLRLVTVALFVTAMGLIWTLTRPAPTVIGRVLAVAPAIAVATGVWTPRPYMVGVIGLALILLALEGRVPPLALVPVLWVWANAHGSFPVGAGLVVLVAIGALVDGERPVAQVRVLAAVAGGVLLAVIGPLGLRALFFPVKALTQSSALGEVTEWQPPGYDSIGERGYLVLVCMTVLALVHRRARWSITLPAVGFAASGLLAQRNIVFATVVLIWSFASTVGPIGSLRSDDRPRIGTAFVAVLAVALLGAALVASTTPPNALVGHPDRALAWLEAVDPADGGRLASQDTTGNLLEVLDGATGEVFVDDRVDMLPEDVFRDEIILARGRLGWQDVLDRWDIDVVLWERGSSLAQMLALSSAWRIVFSDVDSVVACRRSACGPAR
ncbi:MAG TPA: hypothetical protein DCS55_06725 [Acidimicrobiaceae bacterium]|nr:hypothetical protein [Acidimicrobiaceae bacterium]